MLSPFERPHLAPSPTEYPDLAEIRGQEQAKHTLEIAAAGAYSLLFLGPPGTGKSMLANRLPGILPIMTEGEALEEAAVRSVSGCEPFDPRGWPRRPFRAPTTRPRALPWSVVAASVRGKSRWRSIGKRESVSAERSATTPA